MHGVCWGGCECMECAGVGVSAWSVLRWMYARMCIHICSHMSDLFKRVPCLQCLFANKYFLWM